MSVAPLSFARVGLVVGVLALFAGDLVAWARLRDARATIERVRTVEEERRVLLIQQRAQEVELQRQLRELQQQLDIETAKAEERRRHAAPVGDFPATRGSL